MVPPPPSLVRWWRFRVGSLARRWDRLRSNRSEQLLLVLVLLTLPPAFYWGQLPLRAAFLALLVFGLGVRSLLYSWRSQVEARLDPALPPAVAFYQLFLSDRATMELVALVRTPLALLLALLWGSPLLFPLVDLGLGGLFFLYYGGQYYLFHRGSPPAVPGYWEGVRTAFDYLGAHMQQHPRRWALVSGLVTCGGYLGKTLVDMEAQKRVNLHQAELQRGVDLHRELLARETDRLRQEEQRKTLLLEQQLWEWRQGSSGGRPPP
jgi:hypothetical protein